MGKRFEITVIGFNKRAQKMGKAVRVLAHARTRDFIEDNIDALKASMRVGQCGYHLVRVENDGRVIERRDLGRRGTLAAQRGEFREVNAT